MMKDLVFRKYSEECDQSFVEEIILGVLLLLFFFVRHIFKILNFSTICFKFLFKIYKYPLIRNSFDKM